MNLSNRILAFNRLGQRLAQLTTDEMAILSLRVREENPWFTPDQVASALKGICQWLEKDTLSQWMDRYHKTVDRPLTIGVAMAGNIPLVGFHDFLCILIAGHRIKLKLSSQDSVLFRFIINLLQESSPDIAAQIEIGERLKGVDAMIATGSDNTARYFEYYFRNIPHIIRKNRSSCGILLGEESTNELSTLGADIFTYFGLGCRNVSKLFIPEQYDLVPMLEAWNDYQPLIHHHKYFNNYEYQKSILLVNKIPFYDNGFVLLKSDPALVSPISVVYLESYADQTDLNNKISQHAEKLQCIVSARKWYPGSVDFGQAQLPELTDYADRVDTMEFLMTL